jgi:hypothetical protein
MSNYFKLTEKQKELKDFFNNQKTISIAKIKDLEKQIDEEEKRLSALMGTCSHVFKELTKTQIKNNDLGHAKCLICGWDYGYRCLKSPDGVCHFAHEIENSKVELINGEVIYLLNYKGSNYMEDECVYCHNLECPQ